MVVYSFTHIISVSRTVRSCKGRNKLTQSSPFQSTQICQKPTNALICFSCDRYWSSVSKIRKDPVKYHLSVTQTVCRSTRLTERLSDYRIFCKSKQGCDILKSVNIRDHTTVRCNDCQMRFVHPQQVCKDL